MIFKIFMYYLFCINRFSKYPEIQNVSVNPEYMANYERKLLLLIF